MIFVDTSAIVAMLAREPDGLLLADKLEQAGERITAGHVILESAMRLSFLVNVAPSVADSRITALLRDSAVDVVPITEDVAHVAFERYGKGRKNRAGLNFGDCLSYACAKVHGARLLFKGGDFAHADIARA